VKKNTKSEFRQILDEKCEKNGKGRFKTSDVIKIAERIYWEQQLTIKALRQHLNSITRRR